MADVSNSGRGTGSRVLRRRLIQTVAVCALAALALVACRNAPVSGDPNGELHAAMERFTSSVAEAEALVRQVPGLSEQDRTEGYRYLAGLVRWALDRKLANPDMDHPCFRRTQDTFTKWGLDNPDNLYANAQISDQGDYLISGTRGTAAYLAFQVMAGTPGDGSLGRPIDAIDLSRLQVNADGTYEIVVSPQPHSGNWLKSGAGANLVLVRQSLSDWTKETPGEVHIRRVGHDGGPSEPLNAKVMASMLAEAGRVVVAQTRYWLGYIEGWKALPVNTLTAPALSQGGLPGQISSRGHYRLADDEALIITVSPSDAPYQGFQLGHFWWFVSFDYKTRQSSLTTGQAHVSSDGLYRLVVSTTDPGLPNWLDTGGHQEGFMFLRWQGLTSPVPSQPGTQLVRLADLRNHLPADEPVVTAVQRQAQLALREAAVNQRLEQ